MILAVIESSGGLINKPVFSQIRIEDETAIAVRRRNEETEKIEQLTIKELFDAYLKKSNYFKGEDEVSPKLFEEWFIQKYIRNTSLETRLISINYSRL